MLHGCAKAIKQIRRSAKPSRRTACVISAWQPVEPEAASSISACLDVKLESEGQSAKAESAGCPLGGLSYQAEPAGSLSVCQSRKAPPNGTDSVCQVAHRTSHQEGNASEDLSQQLTAQQPQSVQDFELRTSSQSSQLPQAFQPRLHQINNDIAQLASARHGQAEAGSEWGEAGVNLGSSQDRVGSSHGQAAVKRRCMPQWGKSLHAQTDSQTQTQRHTQTAADNHARPHDRKADNVHEQMDSGAALNDGICHSTPGLECQWQESSMTKQGNEITQDCSALLPSASAHLPDHQLSSPHGRMLLPTNTGCQPEHSVKSEELQSEMSSVCMSSQGLTGIASQICKAQCHFMSKSTS